MDDSSAPERITSMRELCAIHQKAMADLTDRGPSLVKDETEGWIVKKGAHLSDEDSTLTSAPSISPDDLDTVHDPFSTYAYDDFLEYEFPKKQQQQIKRRASMNSAQPQHEVTISSSHEPSDHRTLMKRRRMDAESSSTGQQEVVVIDPESVSSMRMSDFLPSSRGNSNSSNPVYRTEWSHDSQGQSGRAMPTTAPMHSHLRCVDPNKTWNMLTRTTGPTTNLHPSQHHQMHALPQQGNPRVSEPLSRTPHTYPSPKDSQPKQHLQVQQTALELSDALKRFASLIIRPPPSLSSLLFFSLCQQNRSK
jgi:hypothetical protein